MKTWKIWNPFAPLQKYIVNLMNKSLDLWYTPTPCHPPIHFDRCSACFYFHGCFKSQNVHIGAETGGSHTLCRVKWPFQFLGHQASTHFWFHGFHFMSVEEWLTKSDWAQKLMCFLFVIIKAPIVHQTFAVIYSCMGLVPHMKACNVPCLAIPLSFIIPVSLYYGL